MGAAVGSRNDGSPVAFTLWGRAPGMADDGHRYFEELEVSETVDCGTIDVTEDEMLEFANRYDPQPFHVDPDAAAQSMYGDIIASGWLTAALSARLLVLEYMNDNATVGGTGIDDLRWHRPVYAGDTLAVSVELVDKHAGDNPLFGHTTAEVVTVNQHGDEVLTMKGLGLVEKADPA